MTQRVMSSIERMHELQAFIEDVKECEHCDTTNMNKVVYCKAHRAALDRMKPLDIYE